MKQIKENLYQFSIYIPPMDFTLHQYLLAMDPSILFAAGTVQQAEQILPEIRRILGNRELKYIFVSHMESDECGGLSVFLKEYPDVTVICGGLAARELSGYGYKGSILVKSGGQTLEDGDLSLRFFNYPAEVHDQDGILCYEENIGIFYSADLMLRFGNGVGQVISSDWSKEVEAIGNDRIAVSVKREELKEKLRQIHPNFVAVGHGFCITCEER